MFALQIVPHPDGSRSAAEPVLARPHDQRRGDLPGLELRDIDHSFATIWIAHTIFALPLAIFLLHNFIAEIPSEVIEAARVDGAGHGQIFFRIVLPLARRPSRRSRSAVHLGVERPAGGDDIRAIDVAAR